MQQYLSSKQSSQGKHGNNCLWSEGGEINLNLNLEKVHLSFIKIYTYVLQNSDNIFKCDKDQRDNLTPNPKETHKRNWVWLQNIQIGAAHKETDISEINLSKIKVDPSLHLVKNQFNIAYLKTSC